MEPEDLVYFELGNQVLIKDRPYTVRAVRRADKGHHQVAFEEVLDRNAAEEIRNTEVLVEERRQLEEDEYWPDQLIGLEVRPGGGTVTAVTHGPAQVRISVERDGVVFEVPFVESLVPVVDLASGYLEIVEIDGLTPPSA